MILQASLNQQKIVRAETHARIGRYVKLNLPTDMTNGKLDRYGRQYVGALGEFLVLRQYGQTPNGPWTRGLDGGVDLRIPAGSVNLMTCCGRSCNYCYHPTFKPIKADIVMQARCLTPDTIQLVAWLEGERFNKLKQPVPIAPQCLGVKICQMRPIKCMQDLP